MLKTYLLHLFLFVFRSGEVGEAPTTGEDVPHFVQHVLGIAAPLLHHARALMVTLGPFGFMVIIECLCSCVFV